jgi:hypothetical protein
MEVKKLFEDPEYKEKNPGNVEMMINTSSHNTSIQPIASKSVLRSKRNSP